MHLAIVVVIFAIVAECTTPERKKFDGYSVVRLEPHSDAQLEFLYKLAENNPQLDFWVPPSTVNRSVDIMVPPDARGILEKYLDAQSIDSKVLISDVERLVDMTTEKNDDEYGEHLTYRAPAISDPEAFFKDYQPYITIMKYMKTLAEERSDIASIKTIGKSWEGRELSMIQIGSNEKNTTKKVIYIDGGTHGREWVTPTTALFIATRLVKDYGSDESIKKLVDDFDWYILPVANPDGYEYSRLWDRMWRKTRSSTRSIFGCKGVDPNRNWDFHWNEIGSSGIPCSEIFAGGNAFSEPEVRAIANFITENKHKIIVFLTLHSYSQLWLTPWGYTSMLPSNYKEMEDKAKIAVEALSKVHGTKFTVGSSTNLLYAAAGGADDWAHGVANIDYVYTVELRDRGRYGFLLPNTQIIPTGEETWAGIKALAEAITVK